MESSIIFHGTRGQSCPPVPLVIGRQTSLWAGEPAEQGTMGRKITRSLLAWSDTHGQKNHLMSPAFLRGDPSMPLVKTQNMSLDSVWMVRKSIPTQPTPRQQCIELNSAAARNARLEK